MVVVVVVPLLPPPIAAATTTTPSKAPATPVPPKAVPPITVGIAAVVPPAAAAPVAAPVAAAVPAGQVTSRRAPLSMNLAETGSNPSQTSCSIACSSAVCANAVDASPIMPAVRVINVVLIIQEPFLAKVAGIITQVAGNFNETCTEYGNNGRSLSIFLGGDQ